MPAGKVTSVTTLANTPTCLTAKGSPGINPGYPGGNDFIHFLLIYLLIPVDNRFSGLRMNNSGGCQTPHYPFGKRRQHFSFLRLRYPYPVYCAAVLLQNDNIMSGINQPSGQIAALRRPQGGISQPLTGAVSGDKVLQDTESFTEARLNRKVDYPARRTGHQAPDTRHLPYLGNVTFGARGRHHINTAVAVKAIGDSSLNLVGSFRPLPDNTAVSLVLGD